MNPCLPAWYEASRVILSVDVAAVLATGEHPLHGVQRALAQATPGAIVELRSTFEPTPLIDLFRGEGLDVWVGQDGAWVHTCILKG